MKRKLGTLVLTLLALVITAACASTGPSSKPTPPQPDAGETWARAAPSQLPSQPARAAAVPTARLAE